MEKDKKDKKDKKEKKGVLDVIAISAAGLKKSDFLSRSSDPYCLLVFGQQKWKTNWIKKNLNPIWNEGCSFTFDPSVKSQTLLLKVYDWDVEQDDFLGQAEIQIDLTSTDIHEKTLALNTQGTVTFSYQVEPSKKSGLLSSHGKPLKTIPIRLNWGDLVLFNMKNISGATVSAATQNKWNHIGIIIQDEKGRLKLLESTGSGVKLYNLDDRLNSYIDEQTVLGFRRLETERTKEQKALILERIQEYLGKPYEEKKLQLLRSRAKMNKTDDLSSFFCSELVAAVYKDMQILKETDSSNNYLPGDFAGNIKLTDKGTLSKVLHHKRIQQ